MRKNETMRDKQVWMQLKCWHRAEQVRRIVWRLYAPPFAMSDDDDDKQGCWQPIACQEELMGIYPHTQLVSLKLIKSFTWFIKIWRFLIFWSSWFLLFSLCCTFPRKKKGWKTINQKWFKDWICKFCLYIHSFIHLFVRSFILSFIYPSIYLFIHSFIHFFIVCHWLPVCWYLHSFIQPIIHPFILSSIHLFIHSNSFNHPFILSLIN